MTQSARKAGEADFVMIAELGHYALVLALGLALIQSIVPIVGTRTNDAALTSIAVPAALAQFFFVAMAFGSLAVCYVTSDFSVLNVFENSNSAMPFVYRLSSVWGNHEGSMMLWVLILAFFGALVAAFGNNLPATLKANALAVQAWIAAAFQLFILTTSNPFLRIADAPFEGRDLNPILQDPGLAIHPPMLYLGYVGFSITFSFAIAALIDGRIDAAWARWVRPWALAAWMCLTLGIAMGSYWAYYELGWGGFWFWDPVENASLMPWIAGTALASFRRGDGKAQRAQGLDHPAGDSGIFAVADRNIPGALGRAHLGARVCHRSDARHFHSGHPGLLHRRRLRALCVARADAQAGRAVCADLARGRARAQQSVPDVGLRHGVCWHALSARARSAHRRQDFSRSAVLQRDVRAAVSSASRHRAVRTADGVEARRPHGCRTTAVGGRHVCCRHHSGGLCAHARRACACAVRYRSRGVRDGWRSHRHRRAHDGFSHSVPRGVPSCGRTASFDLGHRIRPFRPWRIADRHRFSHGLRD